MEIEQISTKVVAAIWQAFAQSDVQLDSVPHDQQQKLVETIAQKILPVLDEVLDEYAGELPDEEEETPENTSAEKVIWNGRPFLSLVEYYTITTERIKVRTGFFGRSVENFELIRIQDIDYKQGLHERIMGIGDIRLHGQDPSHPEIILRNVSKPEEVYETLRRAWMDARKRYGLQFREFM